MQLHVRGAAEFADLYVAVVIAQHVGGVDGVLRDVTAHDGEVQQFLLRGAFHAQSHFAALGPFQGAQGAFVGQVFAYKEAVVHRHDAVTGQHAYLLGRASGHDAVDMDGVLQDGELYAHAAEAAFQFGVYFLQVFGGDISGVGVQFGQNLRHGVLHQFRHVHGVYVLVFDDMQQGVQLVGRGVDDAQLVASVMLGIECPDEDAQYHADGDDQGGEAECIFVTHNIVSD